MVNTCEPVIKIVMRERAKVVGLQERLEPKGTWAGARSQRYRLVDDKVPSVDSGYLTSHMLQQRNVETPYISHRRLIRADAVWGVRCGVGEWTSREAGRSVCGLEMSEEANAAL
jgi:hypothetical protein